MKFSKSVNLLLLAIFMVLLSCKGRNESVLDRVLSLAGDNRVELEKVLAYYKSPKDSLKYKAAIYLIENMEDKFSYTGLKYKYFLTFLDSISNDQLPDDNYKASIDSFFKVNKTLVGNLEKVYDVQIITSEYLIEHINQVFSTYHISGWNADVSFEVFCEYVLPYRLGNEPLVKSRRKEYYDKFKYLLASSPLSLRSIADSVLSVTSQQKFEVITFPDFMPDFAISSLDTIKGGTCRDASARAIYILRSLGIPVAYDYTPQWPHRSKGHSWSALIIDADSSIDFGGSIAASVGKELRLSTSNRIAKVFRKTYSKQKESLAAIHGSEDIPSVFQTPYMKDVSKSYFKGIDIEFSVPGTFGNRFAYLCIFDNLDWVPIHWSMVKDNKLKFTNMGTSIVYLPATYQNGKILPISNPFLVDSTGSVIELNADEKVCQNLVLKRKYPVFDWWSTRGPLIVGSRFQGANNALFRDAVTVYEISGSPEMSYQNVAVKNVPPFRFWRYIGRDSTYAEIAEIEFYESSNNPVLPKAIFGNRGFKKNRQKEMAFDRDPLTFYQAADSLNNWIGVEFNTPIKLKRIRYLCRNDDNFIKEGESYELYYWKRGCWKLHVAKVGDRTQVLSLKNAPTNALFLLHNPTKGKEERIFTIEKGTQRWW